MADDDAAAGQTKFGKEEDDVGKGGAGARAPAAAGGGGGEDGGNGGNGRGGSPSRLLPFQRRRRGRSSAAPPSSAGSAAAGGGAGMGQPTDRDQADRVQARNLLEDNADEFDSLEKRAKLFLRAKQNLTIDDDWIKSQTLFGITTYYRREGDGSLSIKLEGHLSGIPLFEQLCVLRESDLYHTWAPFCTSSRRLAQLGKIDVVSWFVTGLPGFGISRDACFRAVGCDCMREDGSIVLVGEGLGDRIEDGADVKPYLGTMDPNEPGSPQSAAAASKSEAAAAAAREEAGSLTARTIDREESMSAREISSSSAWVGLSDEYPFGSYLSRDSILDTIQLPPVPSKFGAGRMTIRSFQGVIDVLSPSSARTRLVTNIDPNLRFVPQSLIDFCMKKMCGVLLSRLQGAARGVIRDPVRSVHARRMREDAQFYRLWLLPKFRRYCEDLGWDLPPVAAFNVSEEDLDEEEWLLYSQLRQEATIRRVHSAGDLEGAAHAGVSRARDGLLGETTVHSEMNAEYAAAASGMTPRSVQPTSDSLQSPIARAKLHFRRHLFPAESMEIALTSPDLLKRWEQRMAKKKALQVAASRRKAALRLKPALPSKEQEKRLRELREAKRRFLTGGGRERAATSARATTDQNEPAVNTEKKDLSNNTILDIVAGTHPAYSPAKALPVMLLTMFVVYHADNGRLYAYVTSPIDKGNTFDSATYFMRQLSRGALSALLLILYGVIHWIVLNMALILAFDSVELPFMAPLPGRKQSLNSAKVLYTKTVRRYTGYFTVAISAVALGNAIVSAVWKNFVLNGITKMIEAGFPAYHTFVEMSGLQAILDNLPTNSVTLLVREGFSHATAYVSPKFSQITSWATEKLIHPRFVWAWENVVFLTTSFTFWIYSGFLSLKIAMFTVEISPLTWRENALDTSKILLSYSAVFVLSILLMARVLSPKIRRRAHAKSPQERTLPARDEDERSRDTVSFCRAVSSFSLASGELLPNQSTRSLESMPSQGSEGQSLQSHSSGFRSLSSRSLGSSDGNALNELRKMASRQEVIHEEDVEESDYGEVIMNDAPPSVLSDPTLSGAPIRIKKLKRAKKLFGIPKRRRPRSAVTGATEGMMDGHVSSSDDCVGESAPAAPAAPVSNRVFRKSATWAC